MAIFENKSKELIIENFSYPWDPSHWTFKGHEQVGTPNIDSPFMVGNKPLHAEYTPPTEVGGYYKLDGTTLHLGHTSGTGWNPIVNTSTHATVKFGEVASTATSVVIDDYCILYDESGFVCTQLFSGLTQISGVLDLTNLIVLKATGFNYMFDSSRMSEVKFGKYFYTGTATSMVAMFQNCSNLTTLDLSGWDMTSVTTTNSMLYGCSALAELNVSGWEYYNITTETTSVVNMFANCTALKTIHMDNCDANTIKAFLGYRYEYVDPESGQTIEEVAGYLPREQRTIGSVTYYTNIIETLSLKNCNLDINDWLLEDYAKVELLFTACMDLETIDLEGAVISSGDGTIGDTDLDLSWCTSLADESQYAIVEALKAHSSRHIMPLPHITVYSVYTSAQELAESKNWELSE